MAQIYSPLPGTFYRSSAPDKPPFKADGDAVAVGDVIGLVEVMKSFHEVQSEVAELAVSRDTTQPQQFSKRKACNS